MTQIVIMPGGFHPFHAGHAALYNSAREAFPGAEVYVAATNDTSSRPFPFAVKEKLAKLAGVESGHFVQVKSPFQAQEITSKFDPAQDQLIFVRSDKDATKQPQAGGVKKDGTPSYLQPLAGQKQLQPFAKHAYMAYLPTVEFGPGMTSATEIRSAWPQLNEKRKTALVMSLYPATQKNPKLATNVVKMLDTAIGGGEALAEAAKKCPPATQDITVNLKNRQKAINEYGYGPLNPDLPNTKFWMKKVNEWNLDSMEEAQQSLCGNCAAFDIRQDTLDCIAQGIDSDSPEDAEGVIDAGELGYCKFLKFKCASRRTCDAWVTGGPLVDKPVDENQGWAAAYNESDDYIEEKWSQKYKSSINCANPKGFSQKAHCAGRKK
jgi:glycerol-3-phosphate cytidylyltransferase-like family protein